MDAAEAGWETAPGGAVRAGVMPEGSGVRSIGRHLKLRKMQHCKLGSPVKGMLKPPLVSSILVNISQAGAKRMVPRSFRGCPATERGVMAINQNKFCPSVRRNFFTPSLAEHWSRLPREAEEPAEHSKFTWRCFCTCSGRPCLGRGFGVDGLQRSLPILTLPRFCDPNHFLYLICYFHRAHNGKSCLCLSLVFFLF